MESFQLLNTENREVVFTGKPVFSGPVDKWKKWLFRTVDFSSYRIDGYYTLQISFPGKTIESYPFSIGKNTFG